MVGRMASASDPAAPHLDELVAHLVRTTALSPGEAARVVSDVLGVLDETVERYVQRRHLELQREGLVNDRIFERIAAELGALRFRAPTLSLRQLRRIVYG